MVSAAQKVFEAVERVAAQEPSFEVRALTAIRERRIREGRDPATGRVIGAGGVTPGAAAVTPREFTSSEGFVLSPAITIQSSESLRAGQRAGAFSGASGRAVDQLIASRQVRAAPRQEPTASDIAGVTEPTRADVAERVSRAEIVAGEELRARRQAGAAERIFRAQERARAAAIKTREQADALATRLEQERLRKDEFQVKDVQEFLPRLTKTARFAGTTFERAGKEQLGLTAAQARALGVGAVAAAAPLGLLIDLGELGVGKVAEVTVPRETRIRTPVGDVFRSDIIAGAAFVGGFAAAGAPSAAVKISKAVSPLVTLGKRGEPRTAETLQTLFMRRGLEKEFTAPFKPVVAPTSEIGGSVGRFLEFERVTGQVLKPTFKPLGKGKIKILEPIKKPGLTELERGLIREQRGLRSFGKGIADQGKIVIKKVPRTKLESGVMRELLGIKPLGKGKVKLTKEPIKIGSISDLERGLQREFKGIKPLRGKIRKGAAVQIQITRPPAQRETLQAFLRRVETERELAGLTTGQQTFLRSLKKDTTKITAAQRAEAIRLQELSRLAAPGSALALGREAGVSAVTTRARVAEEEFITETVSGRAMFDDVAIQRGIPAGIVAPISRAGAGFIVRPKALEKAGADVFQAAKIKPITKLGEEIFPKVRDAFKPSEIFRVEEFLGTRARVGARTRARIRDIVRTRPMEFEMFRDITKARQRQRRAPLLFPLMETERIRKRLKVPEFLAFIRRGGLFKPVGKKGTKAEAAIFGSKQARLSLGRSFILVKTGRLIPPTAIKFPSLGQFRRPKGKSVLPGAAFVERAKFALTEEQAAIQRARRRAPKKRGGTSRRRRGNKTPSFFR